jgi:hypothetical protein
MSKITTEDCKNFIKDILGLSSTANIKRDRKYKDANGDVIRVFLINNLDTYLIKEDNKGQLSIVTEAMVTQKEKNFNAKSFLKKYIKKLSDDENDEIEVSHEYLEEGKRLSAEDKLKLANEFYYCFPLVYDNDVDSVTNGLDTPMFRSGKYETLTYGIFFHDSLSSDPELYLDEIVKVIIPTFFEKVDENIFEMKRNNTNKDMTINDVITLFDSLGFSYKNCPEFFGEEDDCMLKHLNLK